MRVIRGHGGYPYGPAGDAGGSETRPYGWLPFDPVGVGVAVALPF